MLAQRVALITIFPFLFMACAHDLPVTSLEDCCSTDILESKHVTVSRTDLRKHFENQKTEQDLLYARNNVQSGIQTILTHRCKTFWQFITPNGKIDDEETDNDFIFYFVRSGARGVINEKQLDRFCGLNSKDKEERKNPSCYCSKPDRKLKISPNNSNCKIVSQSITGSLDINLSRPPVWFQPEIKLPIFFPTPPSFLLKPVEAEDRVFPAPFLFDDESQRPPVWVYRLDDAAGFQSALKSYIQKLDEEKNIRRKQINDKIAQGQQKGITDYSIEEAINDVIALNMACHVEPLLELQPKVPTLKNLEGWLHRVKTQNSSVDEIKALKVYWAQQKCKFQNAPLILNLIHTFTKFLEVESAKLGLPKYQYFKTKCTTVS